MIYQEFNFKNYKGIREQSIPIVQNGKPMVLLGRNESGKTTLMSGILHIFAHLRNPDLHEDKALLSPLIPTMNPSFNGTMQLGCVINSEHDEKIRFTITYGIEAGVYSGNRTYEYYINNTKLESTAEIRKIKNRLKTEAPAIWHYEDFRDKVKEVIYYSTTENILSIKTIEKTALQDRSDGQNINIATYSNHVKSPSNVAWQKILDDLLCYTKEFKDKPHKSGTFQKDVVDYIQKHRKAGESTYANRLYLMEEVLNTHISRAWQKISKENFQGKILFQADNQTNGIDGNSYKKYCFKVQEAGIIDDIKSRSSGFNWYFTFILYTELRKNRDKNAIFLLDEPASNLHPESQEELLKAINSLAKDVTVMYSTHSPYLLSAANIDNIYICTNSRNRRKNSPDKNNNMKYTRYDPAKKAHADIRPIHDYFYHTIAPSLTEYLRNSSEKHDVQSLSQMLKEKFNVNIAYFKKYYLPMIQQHGLPIYKVILNTVTNVTKITSMLE